MANELSFRDYAAIDAVNWSTLSAMRKSPLHYRHLLNRGRADTKELKLGRAGHVAVLEPERFLTDYAVFGGKVRKGKAWDAFKADNAGREILKLPEYERCLAIAEAVRSHSEAARYLAAGIPEETIRWTDPETRLACKGRIDWVSSSRRAKVDLKTARDIEMPVFARAVLRYGYHTQSAFYEDGWSTQHGEQLPSVIIAVESSEPYDVGVFRIDEDTVELGRDEYKKLLAQLSVHRGLDTWPGRYPLEMRLELPPWAFGDDEDSEDLGLTGWKENDNGGEEAEAF